MDDGYAILAALAGGGILLAVAGLMRRCATVLQGTPSDALDSVVFRKLLQGVGAVFAVIGIGSLLIELLALLVQFDLFALSISYFPACLSVAAALVLVIAIFIAQFTESRRRQSQTAVLSDELLLDTAGAANPKWWRSPPSQLTAAAAIMAICGAWFMVLDIATGVPNSTPPSALMIPAVLSLVFSMTGMLLIQGARLLHPSLRGRFTAERERLVRSLRNLSLIYFLMGAAMWFLPGLVLGALLTIMAIGAVAAGYRAARLATLWTVATTLRSGRALSDELEAQASAANGATKRFLKRAADELSEGHPLSELLYTSGVVPRSCWLQAAGGLASGRLPDALRAAAARETARFSTRSGTDNSRYSAGYFLMLCFIGVSILGFVMYYIIPKFKKIFEDFNTGLPNATQVLIQVSDSAVNYWYLFAPFLMFAGAAAIALEIQSITKGWPELLEQYLGPYWVRLRAPDLLRGLKWGVAAERPLNEVLEHMARVPLPMAYRARLFHAAKRLERGEELWGVLQAQGWLTGAEADLLRIAQVNGNLPWALDTLSESSQNTREYRFAALMECTAPLILLALGLIVGAIVYALFLPLVFLTMNLA